jgi:hypothetical protein
MQSRTCQKCEIAHRLWRDNLDESACCLSQQGSHLKTVAAAEMLPLPHRIAGFRRPRRHQIELGGLLYGDSLRMSGAMCVSTLLMLTSEVACDLFIGSKSESTCPSTAAGPISEWVPGASQSLRAQLPFNSIKLASRLQH